MRGKTNELTHSRGTTWLLYDSADLHHIRSESESQHPGSSLIPFWKEMQLKCPNTDIGTFWNAYFSLESGGDSSTFYHKRNFKSSGIYHQQRKHNLLNISKCIACVCIWIIEQYGNLMHRNMASTDNLCKQTVQIISID